jgi:serine/threonine protein kinase
VGAGGFRKELDVLTQYRHPNIVCLLGHCLSDGSGGGGGDAAAQPQQQPPPQPPRQCLVFEFMAGGSLNARLKEGRRAPQHSSHLNARLKEGRRLGEGEGKCLAAAAQPLTAEERFGIASDVARGLAYLHTAYLHLDALPTPLIHQDVKSDNILLAEVSGQLIAKVADFGTARVLREEQGQRSLAQTHHSTKAVVGTTPYMPMEVSLIAAQRR